MEKKKVSKEVATVNSANKKKARFQAYAATGRLEANKKRRMAKEERRQAADAAKRPARVALRKIGAVSRLERRIDAAKKLPEKGRLARSWQKATAAAKEAIHAAA